MQSDNRNFDRIINSSRNLVMSVAGQVIIAVVAYFERKVFIDFLADTYLGLNDLFVNILRVLSLAEMGFGQAIVFCLYKPIAEDNIERIKSLMAFFRKVYKSIGLIVLAVGLIIVPFLPIIAKSDSQINGLYIYFILYLLSSALPYFFSYKTSLIEANQKQYIVTFVSNLTTIILYAVSITTLIITRSYFLYLILHIIANLTKYIILTCKANKMYPFLKDKNVEAVDKEDLRSIKKNVFSMIFLRFGDIAVGSSDNLIISTFMGISYVASYSNYVLLRGTCITALETYISSMKASIGNLCALETRNEQINSFKTINFSHYLLVSFMALIIGLLGEDFVSVLFAPRFAQGLAYSFVVGLNLYLYGMRMVVSAFIAAKGLFWANKIRPIIESTLNIVFSILLVKKMGVIGVMLGTTISTVFACSLYEPYILYKNAGWDGFGKYIFEFIGYMIQTVIVGFVVYLAIRWIDVTGLFTLIIKIIATVIIIMALFFIRYCKSPKIRPILETIKVVISNKRK